MSTKISQILFYREEKSPNPWIRQEDEDFPNLAETVILKDTWGEISRQVTFRNVYQSKSIWGEIWKLRRWEFCKLFHKVKSIGMEAFEKVWSVNSDMSVYLRSDCELEPGDVERCQNNKLLAVQSRQASSSYNQSSFGFFCFWVHCCTVRFILFQDDKTDSRMCQAKCWHPGKGSVWFYFRKKTKYILPFHKKWNTS